VRDRIGLVRQYLDSAYGSDQYANWPLDRRLAGFFVHHCLGHLAGKRRPVHHRQPPNPWTRM
jgi:hypothetical protein